MYRNSRTCCWRGGAVLLVVLLQLQGCVAQKTDGCVCTMPSGYTYDLTRFGTDTVETEDGNYYKFTYAPCGPVKRCPSYPSAALCREYNDFEGYGWSLGKFKADCAVMIEEPYGPGKGVRIHYDKGTTVGGSSMESDINFKCSDKEGDFQYEQNEAGIVYEFSWESPRACPINDPNAKSDEETGGLSVGWILIIVVSCVMVLYIVGGTLFNKYYRHHSGWELIPNKDFWIMLPGLVKDGHIYTYQKLTGCVARARGFETV